MLAPDAGQTPVRVQNSEFEMKSLPVFSVSSFFVVVYAEGLVVSDLSYRLVLEFTFRGATPPHFAGLPETFVYSA